MTMTPAADFHSHILPGIDDGSASVEESLALLRLEAEQGIRHVVATPHFYPRYTAPERFLEKRNRAAAQLREAMKGESGLPRITLGAEVYFFRGMSESEHLNRLTIGQKRCILIEMPPPPWPEEIYRELVNIRERQGLTPIIAHVDRYIAPFRTHNIPRRLSELPVLVQANAEFFLKNATAGTALRMLKADQIQLLGSDCHNLTDRRPNLGEALCRIGQKLGPEALETIREYETRILGA